MDESWLSAGGTSIGLVQEEGISAQCRRKESCLTAGGTGPCRVRRKGAWLGARERSLGSVHEERVLLSAVGASPG